MEIITKQNGSHSSIASIGIEYSSHHRAKGEGREVDELSAGIQTREYMTDRA